MSEGERRARLRAVAERVRAATCLMDELLDGREFTAALLAEAMPVATNVRQARYLIKWYVDTRQAVRVRRGVYRFTRGDGDALRDEDWGRD